MGFNDLLKKLFGNKSQRDLKEIEPYIQKIKAISPELEKLSNDELRSYACILMISSFTIMITQSHQYLCK